MAHLPWARTGWPRNDAVNAERTAPEGERFLRIVSDSLRIKSHCELFAWLNGDLRRFLPHQILISAWGNFANGDLELDVISGLPGVRTAQIARCRVDDLVRPCYAQWVSAGRKPLALKALEVMAPHPTCTCRVHLALRNMRSVLVHGVRAARNGDESLYIALDSGVFANDWRAERYASLAHLLISQLDIAMRKVAAFPLEHPTQPQERAGSWLELSSREQEILDWLCRGKTNMGIAAALDISPFTVKNHVKRIFRKLGVGNRVQAAAKYNQSLRGRIALSDV